MRYSLRPFFCIRKQLRWVMRECVSLYVISLFFLSFHNFDSFDVVLLFSLISISIHFISFTLAFSYTHIGIVTSHFASSSKTYSRPNNRSRLICNIVLCIFVIIRFYLVLCYWSSSLLLFLLLFCIVYISTLISNWPTDKIKRPRHTMNSN